MPMDLRPLTLGELLDRSFSLYRTHFRLFVAIMIPPAVFAAGFGLLTELLPRIARSRTGAPDANLVLMAVGSSLGILLLLLVYFVAYMVALGATTTAVSELYMGRTPTAGSAYRRVRDRIGRLMLLMVTIWLRLTGVLVAGVLAVLLVTSIVPGVFSAIITILIVIAGGLLVMFMSLRYALSIPAVSLEPVTARGAIDRSVELTSGNLLRVLVLGIFATIITYITAIVFQGPFTIGAVMAGPDTNMALWLGLIGALTGAIAGAISGPIMIIALALLYYDARVRHEGLDLQLMLQTLDNPGSAPVARDTGIILPG